MSKDVQFVEYGMCQCGCGEKAPISPNTLHAMGYVKGEPRRFVRGHHMRLKFASPEERFWARVNKDGAGGCWLWTGPPIASGGYGTIGVDGKDIRAHRFSWELHNGPIPDGLLVCHHCDVPACVNPEHLFLGTDADNRRDSVAKGRWAVNGPRRMPRGEAWHAGHDGRMPRGDKHWNAKITVADVRAIRELHASGASYQELADRYGVSYTIVYQVVKRRSWRHVV